MLGLGNQQGKWSQKSDEVRGLVKFQIQFRLWGAVLVQWNEEVPKYLPPDDGTMVNMQNVIRQKKIAPSRHAGFAAGKNDSIELRSYRQQ